MKNFGLILLVLCLAFAGCKKNPNVRKVTGKVYTANTHEPISGATITMSGKLLKNGVFSQTPTLLTSATSGADGSFEFEYEKQNTEQYIFEVNQGTIYTYSQSINMDVVHADNPYVFNAPVTKTSAVQVHISRQLPVTDTTLSVVYTVRGPALPCECCSTDPLRVEKFTDTTFSCGVVADQYFVYSYTVYQGNKIQKFVRDSVKTKPATTHPIEIQY